MKEVDAILRNAVDVVEKVSEHQQLRAIFGARKSVDLQNKVSSEIEAEFNRFGKDIDRQFNEAYNRICKIRNDYEQRIVFLKNMCQHYTDKLANRINAFSFEETEIRQKLSKLEWDLIFLQCVGRSIIEASSYYLCEINFDNFGHTIQKSKKRLHEVSKLLDKNQSTSMAYGTAISPMPASLIEKTKDDDTASNRKDSQFSEVLQLVHESVDILQRLPCTLETTAGQDQDDLLDEARKLLTLCIHFQQKYGTPDSTSSRASDSRVTGPPTPRGETTAKSSSSGNIHYL